MTSTSADRPRGMRSILMILVAAPLVGLALGADEPKAKGAKKAAKLAAAAKSADESARGRSGQGPPDQRGDPRPPGRRPRGRRQGQRQGQGRPPPCPTGRRRRSPRRRSTRPGSTPWSRRPCSRPRRPSRRVTTDEEFVRRVYLDVAGRLPTIGEMRAFVGSRDKQKRAKLIDILLKTPAYAENWARFWRNVIAYRAPEQNPARTNFPAFEEWLAGELAKNKAVGRDRLGDHHGRGADPRERRDRLRDRRDGPGRRAGRRGLAGLHGRADPVRPVPRPPDRPLEAPAVPRVRLVLRRPPDQAGQHRRGTAPATSSSPPPTRACPATRCPT